MGYKQLDLLGLCAGFECTWSFEEPRAFFFQEHRMAFTAAWAAIQDGVWGGQPPLMVRIDAHTDYADGSIEHVNQSPEFESLEDALLFANAMCNDDGDWVDAVVRLGWVTDVLCLYVQPSEWKFIEGPIRDRCNTQHSILQYPDLANGPPDLGCGAVTLNERELRNLIEALELLPTAGVTPRPLPPIWLDIDLDFAVRDVKSADAAPLEPDELRDLFARPIRCIDLPVPVEARRLVSALLSRASLITIASEPQFCCGFSGVHKILAGLRSSFPEHERYFKWFER